MLLRSSALKDNCIMAKEPLVCGTMFYNCPMTPILQTALMINYGYQRVVVKERNFVVIDLVLKRIFMKELQKLVIFHNLTLFNTTLQMDHQEGCRLKIIEVSLILSLKGWTEPPIFLCQHLR